jgi:hypothetical protein
MYRIIEKAVCFCSDETNADFGGTLHRRKTNDVVRVKDRKESDVIGKGYSAHIEHVWL